MVAGQACLNWSLLGRGYGVAEAGLGLLWLCWTWEGLWGWLRPANDV